MTSMFPLCKKHFDITKTTDVDKTFRVASVEDDFDLSPRNADEHFVGTFDLTHPWQIGLIVGGSGTGKTTIAKDVFGKYLVGNMKYTHKSVIDDMPKGLTAKQISMMFYAVGFGSVPSWLKPYRVLSNGEKMRVDIARAIAENQLSVIDEFTSVVDRQVAKVASLAVHKFMKRNPKKQFVAISCHSDIIDWLQPDWIFDTDTMKFHFITATGNRRHLQCITAAVPSGQSLKNITI